MAYSQGQTVADFDFSLSASLENYLEAIHEIVRVEGVARVRDIARRLKVRMPSVHAALHRLSDAGLVEHQRYEYVKLTPAGEEYAACIVRRHRMLKRFLSDLLGVSPRVSEKDACRVEHVVSVETMQRLGAFMDHFDGHREEWRAWLGGLLDRRTDEDAEDGSC